MKIFLLFFTILLTLNAAQQISDSNLKKMIGHLLIVGFNGTSIDKNSQITKELQEYELGGVILFDIDYKNKNRQKNIVSPLQLKKLTKSLKKFSKAPLFIAIDQEGGRVARLKEKYGFSKIPSAYEIAKLPIQKAIKIYTKESNMLYKNGINMNFAPVVDLNINPKNHVIVQLKRSFSKDPNIVAKYAKILIKAQNKNSIISVLKHFPGHGSSLADSHKGFVDVTNTWSKEELEPYKKLIKENMVDAVMSAHIFNKHLDKEYPATLSYKINTELLRKKLKFRGVIISDDMQMKAISQHYSLKDSTTLALNAGVDMLIFGNQLSHNSTKEIINTIFSQVKAGKISLKTIIDANKRVEILHTKSNIIQKPIVFTQKRINMTKNYIKKHYGLNVKNIKIKPKIIVLHWTAVTKFSSSFWTMYPEKLHTNRKYIATASSLNVSSHFLVDRDGQIYQLMPDNFMARHVIGLNYYAIGVENVGGESNKKEDLTQNQIKANIRLIKYLKEKYPNIKYLIGHYEYKKMQKTPLWLEKDPAYRTTKADPGKKFMKAVRRGLKELNLKGINE